MLLQWNINGISSHIEDLKILINDKRPKIVCIQETKLHYFASFNLKGYNVYRRDHYQNLFSFFLQHVTLRHSFARVNVQDRRCYHSTAHLSLVTLGLVDINA